MGLRDGAPVVLVELFRRELNHICHGFFCMHYPESNQMPWTLCYKLLEDTHSLLPSQQYRLAHHLRHCFLELSVGPLLHMGGMSISQLLGKTFKLYNARHLYSQTHLSPLGRHRDFRRRAQHTIKYLSFIVLTIFCYGFTFFITNNIHSHNMKFVYNFQSCTRIVSSLVDDAIMTNWERTITYNAAPAFNNDDDMMCWCCCFLMLMTLCS